MEFPGGRGHAGEAGHEDAGQDDGIISPAVFGEGRDRMFVGLISIKRRTLNENRKAQSTNAASLGSSLKSPSQG